MEAAAGRLQGAGPRRHRRGFGSQGDAFASGHEFREEKTALLEAELAHLRAQIDEIGEQKNLSPSGVAQRVNAVVNASLRKLEEFLGKENFERFFGWPAGRVIVLANPGS